MTQTEEDRGGGVIGHSSSWTATYHSNSYNIGRVFTGEGIGCKWGENISVVVRVHADAIHFLKVCYSHVILVLGKLGPGQLGPGQLGPGKLGPGQLGPGAQLSGAQLSAPKKWQIGPRTVGPQKCTIQKTKKSSKKQNTASKMQTGVYPNIKYVAQHTKCTSKNTKYISSNTK